MNNVRSTFVVLVSAMLIVFTTSIAHGLYIRKGIDTVVEKKIVQEREKLYEVESLISKIKKQQLNAGSDSQQHSSDQLKSVPASATASHAKNRFTYRHQLHHHITLGRAPSNTVKNEQNNTILRTKQPKSDGIPFIAGGEFENTDTNNFFDPTLAKPNYDHMTDNLLN
jgi:hypothetical protein